MLRKQLLLVSNTPAGGARWLRIQKRSQPSHIPSHSFYCFVKVSGFSKTSMRCPLVWDSSSRFHHRMWKSPYFMPKENSQDSQRSSLILKWSSRPPWKRLFFFFLFSFTHSLVDFARLRKWLWRELKIQTNLEIQYELKVLYNLPTCAASVRLLNTLETHANVYLRCWCVNSLYKQTRGPVLL